MCCWGRDSGCSIPNCNRIRQHKSVHLTVKMFIPSDVWRDEISIIVILLNVRDPSQKNTEYLLLESELESWEAFFFTCHDFPNKRRHPSNAIGTPDTFIMCACVVNLQLRVQARLCVLSFLSASSGAARATWKARQWVVILIPPSILIQCAMAFKKWVSSRWGSFSWQPLPSPVHQLSDCSRN